MRESLAVVAAVLLLAGRPGIAEGVPVSTDGSDPRTWDPALDAVKSGARNHRVIYEDQDVRVLSVTVEPGEVERAHHHQWPSVLVFISLTGYENRDAKGIEIPRTVVPGEKVEQPVVARLPPEAAHAVTNKGTTPLRLIRIEYKNGFPK
jgi:mannose-6-phosphate isomerase-like protein (cupin superfamily)